MRYLTAPRRPSSWARVVLARLCLLLLLLSGAMASVALGAEPAGDKPAGEKAAGEKAAGEKATQWKPLFDGKTLSGWKETKYGGEGDVTVEDGRIALDFGSPLTGLTYAKPFPKSNYEIRLEAMRVDGIDFFCCLTFPVKESHCSFVVGGWAGTVVGLSSIDGLDASSNQTTKYIKFDKQRWYKIRVRVTDDRIQAWIDDKQVVDQDLRDKKITTRVEVDPNKPLGICSFETVAWLRKMAYRELKPTE